MLVSEDSSKLQIVSRSKDNVGKFGIRSAPSNGTGLAQSRTLFLCRINWIRGASIVISRSYNR